MVQITLISEGDALIFKNLIDIAVKSVGLAQAQNGAYFAGLIDKGIADSKIKKTPEGVEISTT